ncbi:SDR family oxidoreductase [[Mycobacterium] wendilense]|uniref:SDR family oxidoreductase n=1 Tax=[Mycobacterium] wendilense TaxID=3064284 RepID=A0ABN9P498_9MYCO|nr:SDR family oxidoreductase [Mycolicibacterium sp. MU0050]CAJ1582105.1 SDR family oxidoreductase [Mycolicibacterium sp. MU0050]
MTELLNRSALVTGGTAGIGLACAQLLADAGAQVIISGRDTARGEAAATALGSRARFVPADLAEIDSVRNLVRRSGDVDILVNNAASFPAALTVDQRVDSFEKTFDTNVLGTYFLTAGLAAGMLDRGSGSIVNITSMVASKGVAAASAYSASKAAVESLTRTWAIEFGGRGVRVNCVAPGPTSTEGVVAQWGDTNDELGRALPLGRTAAPAEIAAAVVFLAGPHASFITGTTLHVDGGGSAM